VGRCCGGRFGWRIRSHDRLSSNSSNNLIFQVDCSNIVHADVAVSRGRCHCDSRSGNRDGNGSGWCLGCWDGSRGSSGSSSSGGGSLSFLFLFLLNDLLHNSAHDHIVVNGVDELTHRLALLRIVERALVVGCVVVLRTEEGTERQVETIKSDKS